MVIWKRFQSILKNVFLVNLARYSMSKLLSKCTCIVIFNISSLKAHQMFNRKECANSIKKYHAARKSWVVCRLITIKFPSSDFPPKQEDWAREARGGGGFEPNKVSINFFAPGCPPAIRSSINKRSWVQ